MRFLPVLALFVSSISWVATPAQERAQEQPVRQITSQQPVPSPKPETPGQPPPGRNKTEQEKEIEKREQSQRMLGVVPQFAVTSRGNAPPLAPREKFHLFSKSAFDPVEFGLVGLQAGISQATDEFPGYGQGAQGYGKRYGATFADEVSAGFFSNFFWPVMLKQDPRYFRLGEGSIKHRILYSVRQEFICHTDKGGRAFSFSNVLGAFSGGGLSNIYYPKEDRGLGLTASRSSIALMYGSLGGLIDEFYPDIARKLFHKQQKENSGKTSAGSD